MPLPHNFNTYLGVGVFGVVCAATFYLVDHYRQDRRRHAMVQDLARLHSEVTGLRQELDSLLALQKQKVSHKNRSKRNISKKINSTFAAESTTTDDYSSALDLDSSDLEFYDVSDEEDSIVLPQNWDNELSELDIKLDDGGTLTLETCLEKLQNLCIEHPENPHLLWRIGKAHYKLYEKTDDETVKKNHITKGVEACTSALKCTPELADAHKWLALLLGSRSKYQPIKEKIMDGRLFKDHVDAAITLNPLDSSLHHMLGRFCYDVSELKWYEKKVAAALFAEPPNATYEEALEHFEKAQTLSKDEWKENHLFIAKCKIKLGLIDEAVKILQEADNIKTDNGMDEEVDREVKELLSKF